MSAAPLGQHVNRTHCKRGHALTPENILVHPDTGYHLCRACSVARNRKHQRDFQERQKVKLAAARDVRIKLKAQEGSIERLIAVLQAIRNALHAHNRTDTPLPNKERLRLRDLADAALSSHNGSER